MKIYSVYIEDCYDYQSSVSSNSFSTYESAKSYFDKLVAKNTLPSCTRFYHSNRLQVYVGNDCVRIGGDMCEYEDIHTKIWIKEQELN